MGNVASTLSDDTILSTTRQEVKGDRKRFIYEMPEGEPLSSEWMRVSDIKAKVLITWCEIVRATINERHKATMDRMAIKRTRRLQEEAKEAIDAGYAHLDGAGNVIWHQPKAEVMQILSGSSATSASSKSNTLVSPTGEPLSAVITEDKTQDLTDHLQTSSVTIPQQDGVQPVTDPDDYARSKLEELNRRVAALEADGQDLLNKLQIAKAQQKKWTRIITDLSEEDNMK